MLVYKRISSAHLIVLMWVIFTLGLAPVIENTLVKMVLVIPMVLFVPGYMLLSALFAGSRSLGTARTTVLSFGISMVIVPLLGFFLNFAFEIRLVPLLIILGLYTAALASIAAYRSGKPVSHGTGKLPLDLAVISVWIIATLIFILTPALENTPVRTALAVPVILFIPGYVLISVLFPQKNEPGFTERIALSLGISIAVVPLLGVLLNFTTGIELEPILIALCLYSIILAFIAAYRRGKLPDDERFSIPSRSIYETVKGGISATGSGKDAALTLSLIFIAAFAAGMVYFVVSTPKTGEKFTEFYILDQSGKAESYPANLKYDSPVTFPVGVINHEYSFTNYTVQVALDKKILTYTRFMLDHNETWRNNVSFIPGREGTGMKLEFWLFKNDNFTAPYRELQLWVNGVK